MYISYCHTSKSPPKRYAIPILIKQKIYSLYTNELVKLGDEEFSYRWHGLKALLLVGMFPGLAPAFPKRFMDADVSTKK